MELKYFIIDSSDNKKYIDDIYKTNSKLSVEIKLFNKTTQKFQTLNNLLLCHLGLANDANQLLALIFILPQRRFDLLFSFYQYVKLVCNFIALVLIFIDFLF